MPKSQLFTNTNSRYKLSSLLRDPSQQSQQGNHFGHSHHQKHIQVSGRGGMDHVHFSANHTWNRKGRW